MYAALRARQQNQQEQPAASLALVADETAPVLDEEALKERRLVLMSDVNRTILLPCVSYEDIDMQSALAIPKGTAILSDMQQQMLAAAAHAQGLVAFGGTGIGKSWVVNLLGSVVPNVDRVLVFAPSSTLENLRRERAKLYMHFRLHRNVQFLSYEALQRPTPEGQLDFIEEKILQHDGDPGRTIVVFDEAHAIRNLTSSRGIRVFRCKNKHPNLRMFFLSGSMTDKSLLEYAHLAWMALGDGSPVPAPWIYKEHSTPHILASQHLRALARCVDKDGEPDGNDWNVTNFLWRWVYPQHPMIGYRGATKVALARKALLHRLRTCPGVVMSRETSAADVPLTMHGITIEIPEVVKEALRVVADHGLDPAGNILPDQMATYRVSRQLAQGFYYVWDWPVDLETGKPIQDVMWLLARSTWNKHVRSEIKTNNRTGYDSALLVYMTVCREIRQRYARTAIHNAWLTFVSRSVKDEAPGVVARQEREALAAWVEAGGTDEVFDECEKHFLQATRSQELYEAWVAWSSRLKHKAKPPTKAIWVSEYLLDYVETFIKEQEAEGHPVVIWYEHTEMERGLARRKIPVFGAGTEPPTKARTVGLALKVHSEGKNLQAWSRALVLCPPASGRRWEQTIARLHRTGQTEAVRYYAMVHVHEYFEAISSARAAADYVQSQTDNPQKLLHADYVNLKLPKTASQKLADMEDAEEDADTIGD